MILSDSKNNKGLNLQHSLKSKFKIYSALASKRHGTEVNSSSARWRGGNGREEHGDRRVLQGICRRNDGWSRHCRRRPPFRHRQGTQFQSQSKFRFFSFFFLHLCLYQVGICLCFMFQFQDKDYASDMDSILTCTKFGLITDALVSQSYVLIVTHFCCWDCEHLCCCAQFWVKAVLSLNKEAIRSFIIYVNEVSSYTVWALFGVCCL